MQKNLEKLGYFVIAKDKNARRQNIRNVITATLPDAVFSKLKASPDKNGEQLQYQEVSESKRAYLDRSKLFIYIEYEMLKLLCSIDSLSSSEKIMNLDLYVISYKSCLYKAKNSRSNNTSTDNISTDNISTDNISTHSMTADYRSNNNYKCVISYAELAKKHGISESSISRIVNNLEKHNFISKSAMVIKADSYAGARRDKSLWSITVKSLIPQAFDTLSARIDPPAVQIGQHNNKYLISKIKDRSSDHVSDYEEDKSTKRSNFLNEIKEEKEIKSDQSHEVKQNNENNQRGKNHKMKIENDYKKENTVHKLKRRKFGDFHPIAEDDADTLRKLSNRDFSTNYINKLILKLDKERPDNGFYSKKLFLSYMTIVLIREMRETEQVNKVDFKFKSIVIQEQDAEAKDKYLEKIESNQDTSKSAQLRRKVAARFDSDVAYKLLSMCYFAGPDDFSRFTIKVKDKSAIFNSFVGGNNCKVDGIS